MARPPEELSAGRERRNPRWRTAARLGLAWFANWQQQVEQPSRSDNAHAPARLHLEGELRSIYAALELPVAGFSNADVDLISSPRVQVYFHAEVAGQVPWQARRKARLRLPQYAAVPAAGGTRENRAGVRRIII